MISPPFHTLPPPSPFHSPHEPPPLPPAIPPLLTPLQWWRWFTSLLVHQSFAHLLSNLLVWAILAGSLECSYGSLRIFVIWLAAGGQPGQPRV